MVPKWTSKYVAHRAYIGDLRFDQQGDSMLGEVWGDVYNMAHEIEWQRGSPQRGGVLSILISTNNSQNRKCKVGTSGTENVRLCHLRICGSLTPKKRMENSQIRNSQIAIAEIWDSLLGCPSIARNGEGRKFPAYPITR